MADSPEFAEFKSEFTRWQQRFGLMGYKVYFAYRPIDGCFAQLVRPSGSGQVATASLNSALPKKDRPHADPKRTAKHEACHLLCARLYTLATERYLRDGEVDEAEEELVRKLEGLIAD